MEKIVPSAESKAEEAFSLYRAVGTIGGVPYDEKGFHSLWEGMDDDDRLFWIEEFKSGQPSELAIGHLGRQLDSYPEKMREQILSMRRKYRMQFLG